MNESDCGVDTNRQQNNPKSDARVAGQTLRALANCDTPVNQEQPDPVRQMPYRRRDADQIDHEDPRSYKLVMHDRKTLVSVRCYRHRIQTGYQAKAEIQNVKCDEE